MEKARLRNETSINCSKLNKLRGLAKSIKSDYLDIVNYELSEQEMEIKTDSIDMYFRQIELLLPQLKQDIKTAIDNDIDEISQDY